MRRMIHTCIASCAAFGTALLLAGTPVAHAAGPPVENWTEHIDAEVSVSQEVHPCTGHPVELTIAETGVIHFAAKDDGTVHFSGTLRGTFSADALPTDGVADATGSFVVWFGGNGLLLEDGGATGKAQTAFTFNGRGTNADGSTFRWHTNGNTVFDATGTPKLERLHERASCS